MSSSVGILNRTYDNLEKRVARIESQLGRPRSCKYGTTAERTAYGAPVEGVLWWDTTEEVLYVWYNYGWILAKGVMVGGTTARVAASLASPGGMWWDTDEDNLYVWGVSSSWQSVTGAKFGTREQRDAGGFGGVIWICSDEGYAYSYDDSESNWRAVGDSVFDLNWLYWNGGDFAILGHRTLAYDYYLSEQKDVYKVGSVNGYLTETTEYGEWGPAPIIYGQDGLVPYADFSNGGPSYWATYGGNWNVPCYLHPAGSMPPNTGLITVMVWFKIFEYGTFPQPIIGSYSMDGENDWILYVAHNSARAYSPYGPGRWVRTGDLVWRDLQVGFHVSLDTWHFAAVCNDRFKMDNNDWKSCPSVSMGEYGNSGTLSDMVITKRTTSTSTIYTARCHLHGKISMYYVLGGDSLTEGQIEMFYERTRRLHGV